MPSPPGLRNHAKLLEPFGDASYSTYLVHGLILTVFMHIWIAATGSLSAWIVPASLVVATIAGLATHMLVERPLLRSITRALALKAAKSSPMTGGIRVSQFYQRRLLRLTLRPTVGHTNRVVDIDAVVPPTTTPWCDLCTAGIIGYLFFSS